jgi:chemotaxis protein MotB
MVIIFVLLVFVLAQAFLSVALNGQTKALDKVNAQLAQVADALSLERGHSASLEQSVSQLNKDLTVSTAAREALSRQLATLTEQARRTTADLDALRGERAQLTQQLADARQAAQAATTDSSALRGQLDAATQGRQALAAQLADAQRQLADAQQHRDEMLRQIAALDATVTADKATIEAKISDLAKLAEQSRALTALRDELEKQAQDAAARAMSEQQRRQAVLAQLADEAKLGDSARARLALLNQQVDQLKAQLASVSQALDLSRDQARDKDAQISNLGQKLNAALARKVEELQQYRSEFFGKLRSVLAERPGITVVGDRFVFQSEVLFPAGSADITSAGVAQMMTLATTIKEIAAQIPPDLQWVLRVDGHTDPQPVKRNGPFASNWELSAARAITVVKLLIADGVPPQHLAASGFGEYQPFATGTTPDAYAKDRRIELRLTDR